ncbi:MAG TPA: hypothetical protein VEY95_02900 [Azospirillaceae bacterium]|nr:hypothetical protein [Azospirillaceae bacterium]
MEAVTTTAMPDGRSRHSRGPALGTVIAHLPGGRVRVTAPFGSLVLDKVGLIRVSGDVAGNRA